MSTTQPWLTQRAYDRARIVLAQLLVERVTEAHPRARRR